MLRRARKSDNGELAYPVVNLLSLPGCAFCRRSEEEDLRAAWSFLWEGKFEIAIRDRVKQAGGFCAHHNRLVYAVAKHDDLTAGLAEVQELVISGVRAGLDHQPRDRRGHWRSRHPELAIPAQDVCLLRQFCAEAEERMATFVANRLARPEALETYLASDGFCLPHLRMAVAAADAPTAARLVDDFDGRLASLDGRLKEYRRQRDYRYHDEPRGDEQRSALDATHRLVRQRFASLDGTLPPTATPGRDRTSAEALPEPGEPTGPERSNPREVSCRRHRRPPTAPLHRVPRCASRCAV